MGLRTASFGSPIDLMSISQSGGSDGYSHLAWMYDPDRLDCHRHVFLKCEHRGCKPFVIEPPNVGISRPLSAAKRIGGTPCWAELPDW